MQDTVKIVNRGVYFISNDKVYDLTIAFLNSFRRYNPTLFLCFIPYNSEDGKIRTLQKKYDFQIFDDHDILSFYDSISLKFHEKVNGSYRKLAAWEGPLDEFIYIDVDTVLLADVTFTFDYLKICDCLTSHSNISESRKFVWKQNIFERNLLDKQQIDFAANTGFIASKKGFFSKQRVIDKLDLALSLKDCMELSCQEQPFLNFMIVTSDKVYTSLLKLTFTGKYNNILQECWAGLKGAKFDCERIKYKGKIVPVLLIHWAGLWQPRTFDFIWFRLLKFLRIIDKSEKPKLYTFMPYKNIWNFYRNLNE